MGSKERRGPWPSWVLLAPLIVVGVASVRWLSGLLPPCLFRETTGLLCPGCGATRAALALSEGRWHAAWAFNALFVGGVVGGGAWIVLSAFGERFPEVRCLRIFRWRLGFLWLALAAVVVFGVVRNF